MQHIWIKALSFTLAPLESGIGIEAILIDLRQALLNVNEALLLWLGAADKQSVSKPKRCK
jgi:hypothetical protein